MLPPTRVRASCVLLCPRWVRALRAWRGAFCLRGVSFCAILGVSKQKPTQKGNNMSCNCQKCLYEEKPTTDFTAHSAGGDHATFDTRKLVAGTFVGSALGDSSRLETRTCG